MGKTCTVNKPGCCIHGLTPNQAIEAIDTQVAALRSRVVYLLVDYTATRLMTRHDGP